MFVSRNVKTLVKVKFSRLDLHLTVHIDPTNCLILRQECSFSWLRLLNARFVAKTNLRFEAKTPFNNAIALQVRAEKSWCLVQV